MNAFSGIILICLATQISSQTDPLSVAAENLSAFHSAIQSNVAALPGLEEPTALAASITDSRFRFGRDSKPVDPSSRKVFIPQDRTERFTRPILASPNIFSESSTKALPSPEIYDPPLTPEDYYYYYYDYDFDNNTNYNISYLGLGPLDPPVSEGTNTEDRMSEMDIDKSHPTRTSTSATRRTLPFSSRRPPFIPERVGPSAVSLSDLLAQSKSSNEMPSNDLSSKRKGRVSPLFQSEDEGIGEVRVSMTNTTESVMVVSSVRTSQSIHSVNEFGSFSTTTLPLFTSSEKIQEEEKSNANVGERENPELGNDEIVDVRQPETVDFSQPEIVDISQPEAVNFSQPEILDVSPPEIVDTSQPENKDVSQPGKNHQDAVIRTRLETLFSNINIEEINHSKASTLSPFSKAEVTTKKLILDNFPLKVIIKDIPSTSSEGVHVDSDVSTSRSESHSESSILDQLIEIETPTDLLPPGFVLNRTETERPSSTFNSSIVDTSPRPPLPPPSPPPPLANRLGPVSMNTSRTFPEGFKSERTPKNPTTLISNLKIVEIDNLSFLPPGFKLTTEKPQDATSSIGTSESSTSTTETTSTKQTNTAINGLVFPKKPNRPLFTATTTRKPKKQPTFRPQIIYYSEPSVVTQPTTTTTTTSTTTTTTSTTPYTTTTSGRPTTPGTCGTRCKLLSTIRISSGLQWQQELSNRHTNEWKEVANAIRSQLDTLYRKSDIRPYYLGVEIDAFSPGLLVDYTLQLDHILSDLDTVDMKHILNDALVVQDNAFVLGNYTVDPRGTDFIVSKEHLRSVPEDVGQIFLPEWLIAVIAIGSASILFLIFFGIIVIFNRSRVKRRNSRLTEEYFNKFGSSYLSSSGSNYGNDGLYDMNDIWNEKYEKYEKYQAANRSRSCKTSDSIYDSWRSDYSVTYGSSSATYPKRPPLQF